MTSELYSVEQVAERLGLHVRTVRNYVREGRLKAVRIGKQYRISGEDLQAFTGLPVPPSPRESVRRERHIEATSIVQVDAVSPELARRITAFMLGVGKSPRSPDDPLRMETIYNTERGSLKVILTGSLANTVAVLPVIADIVESPG